MLHLCVVAVERHGKYMYNFVNEKVNAIKLGKNMDVFCLPLIVRKKIFYQFGSSYKSHFYCRALGGKTLRRII